MSGAGPTNEGPNSTTKMASEHPTEPEKSANTSPDKIKENMPSAKRTITPDNKTVKNPYSLKRSLTSHEDRITKPSELLITLDEYMTIILSHDKDKNHHPATKLWKKWVANGALKRNVGIHKLASIISYPKKKDKTLKNVGLYILSKITIVDRFMRIPLSTKHHEPLVYHGKPMWHGNNTTKIVTNEREITDKDEGREMKDDKSNEQDKMKKLSSPSLSSTKEDSYGWITSNLKTKKIDPPKHTDMTTQNPYNILRSQDEETVLEETIEELIDDFPTDNNDESTNIISKNDTGETEITDPGDVLEELKHADENFEKTIMEVMENISDKDESSENSERLQIDNYWNMKKAEFTKQADEKMSMFNIEYSKAMDKMKKVENSIDAHATKKTTQMGLDIQNHTDVVNNLTKSTIRTCENYCTQLDNKVIKKSTEYAKDHITALTQEWENIQQTQAEKTFDFWNELKSEITTTQSKLVETNRIAIKNNRILETKLNEAEKGYHHCWAN